MATDETLSKRSHEVNAVRLASVRPYLVLAVQCEQPLERARRYWLHGVDEVLIGRGELEPEGAQVVSEERRTIVVRVPDPRASREHARLLRADNRWVLVDENSKNGVFVNGVAAQRAWLNDGDLFEIGHTFFLFREDAVSPEDDALDAAPKPAADEFATLLPSFARELDKLARVARTQVPVLLEGETGTGKEVIARGYHRCSLRPGPLVPVNCGALPETLLETELFGYRKGAFSGADEQRAGLVRSADGGTLLLDEVAELPFPSQAAFLRVLQESEVVPVGGTRPVRVDFRLLSATHGDLARMVEDGAFRADLYARLVGFKLRLPPLRERRDDLGLIIPAILARSGPEAARVSFSPNVIRAFFAYSWPLNIRELERCLTAALAIARDRIQPQHLPEAIQKVLAFPEESSAPLSLAPAAAPEHPKNGERERLIALLREHRGNIRRVAEALATSRAQVHRLLDRHALDAAEFRR
ncbi:sigma 54-interacting transcriptional regulator [Pendulispora albinea]|uniref:Sigma 54-interacting transcriptional regulator n=1 Tax=Pendulispora albinea TaxID=2741071 RepID=A0ABZ2M039_9BACT